MEVDNKDIDYSQRIYPSANQKVEFKEADSDWEEPRLCMELVEGDLLYTYEIRFSPSLDTLELEDVEIELLGESYIFSEKAGANHGGKLTLLASSQSETIAAGESVTVTAGGTDYVITVVGISEGSDADHNTATIDINGESDSYGVNDDIEEGELDAYVKNINAFKFPVESGSVELFVGSQSLVLENETEITLGGNSIDGTDVTFDNTTTDIDEISITYTMDDDVILEVDDSFEDPVFGGFSVSLGGILPGLMDASKDVLDVQPSGSDLEFTFTNFDDMEYEAVLASTDGTNYRADDGTDDGVIHFFNNETIAEDEYVVVTDNNEYSYLLLMTDFSGSSGEEEATLEDVSTGTEYVITASDYLDTIAVGSLDIVVTGFDTANDKIALNNTQSAADDAAKILLKSGASLEFHVNLTGYYNVTNDVTLKTNEGDFDVYDDAQDPDPQTVYLQFGGTDDIDVDIDKVLAKDADGETGWYLYEDGTFVVGEDIKDEQSVTIYIPDEPTPVYVAFGANPTFGSGEGATAGTVDQAVQIKNSISKMESEVTADASLGRDLVLLGGPCANGLVAELLEMSDSNPACATEFTALYPTEGVITVVEDAFGSAQKALVVAGVNRAATRDLAVKVMQGTVEYSA